ncbi:MAG: putative transcriptional regulator protein GntR family [Rhizobium sp.]|nr:putative transcriptional regulator protein GntR family [Rhizobium sp.]
MSQFSTIARHSGISAWKQIADQISRSISSGEFDDTGMVPPEMVLAEKFGVNRHTVRSAIASLAEEGLLKRVQGRGTLIEKRERLIFPITRRTRFSEGLGKQGAEMSTRLISYEELEATQDIADALALPPGARILRLRTVGSADGQPVSTATSHFDKARFPRMAELVGRHHSVTKAFAAQGVDDYVRVSTEVTGRTAAVEEEAYLKLSPGSVVLVALSVNADLEGRRIQYSRSVFAADKISLKLDTASV